MDSFNSSIIFSNVKFKHFTFYCVSFFHVMSPLREYFVDCPTLAYPLLFLGT
jgi:hypothetical protein